MKKIGSGICIFILLTFILSACGSNKIVQKEETREEIPKSTEKKEDLVTVKFLIASFSDMSDAQLVEDAINEILAARYGIQMELIYVDSRIWEESVNRMLKIEDEVDVLMLYKTALTTYVNNGALLNLDEYYNNSSERFRELCPEEELTSIRFEGKLYSIRNFKNNADYISLNMNAEMVEELGIEIDKIHSLEDVEEVLKLVKETYPDVIPLGPQGNAILSDLWTWDGIGDKQYLGVLENRGQSLEVKNLFDTEEFYEFCSTMRDWYLKGYIMQDILSNTENGTHLVQDGKVFAHFNNSTPAKMEGIVQASIIPAWTMASNYSSLTYGIHKNTKHPDECFTLMEAIYTDHEIISLLVNGIEGVHWVYANEEKTLLTYPEGENSRTAKYNGGIMYWSFPYAKEMIPWAPSEANLYEDMELFNESAITSMGDGMIFDSARVINEYSACLNVM
ncbi:extracellular solute-binding protein, partial [Lachnospiraceae bacterium OttesenSCG-928-D06]|nr:extracellular solute-binding protein [Lachnospiraceae bacterium OttesenSCG-928-D06]